MEKKRSKSENVDPENKIKDLKAAFASLEDNNRILDENNNILCHERKNNIERIEHLEMMLDGSRGVCSKQRALLEKHGLEIDFVKKEEPMKEKKRVFDDAEVGYEVFSERHGIGRIMTIDPGTDLPINAYFGGRTGDWYDLDGNHSSNTLDEKLIYFNDLRYSKGLEGENRIKSLIHDIRGLRFANSDLKMSVKELQKTNKHLTDLAEVGVAIRESLKDQVMFYKENKEPEGE
jgi:hypothetical protein